MANAILVTESSYALQLNNLSKDQIIALKALVQNPPHGIDPELETALNRELRKIIWEACKDVYL